MTGEPADWPEQEPGPAPDGQSFTHTPIAARIPEGVRRGVFCTGTMILQTSDEFIVDFMSTMTPPQQLVARVIMMPRTFSQMIAAIEANLGRYQQQFGRLMPRDRAPAAHAPPPNPSAPAPSAPAPAAQPDEITGTTEVLAYQGSEPTPPRAAPGESMHALASPPIDELYDQLKIPDDLLGGVFANVVMIRHTPEEFCLDFIANFFPRSVVVSRVFFSAGRIPSFLEAMVNAMRKYQHRMGGPSS